jgi:uncharacterized phage protein gp47/JayE
MPIIVPADSDLRDRAIAFIRNRLPNVDLSEDSYFGQDARAKAALASLIYQAVALVDKESPPSDDTTLDGLSAWAFVLGLPNGAGNYGARVPQTATGGIGPVTGTNGTTVNAGSLLTGPDGVTQYELRESVTISGSPPGTGSATGTFDAISAGAAGNLAAGQKLTWSSPVGGIDSTVTLSTRVGAEVAGTDAESAESLLARILARFQTPPRGGSAWDYRAWCESFTGVARAYPYPHRDGVGTVHVVLTAGGSGINRRPLALTLDTVRDGVNGDGGEDGLRPVPAEGFAPLSPYMVATGMRIRVRVTLLSTAFAFDWTDTATSYTVDTYTVGPPDTLKLNTLAPADLKAAIDAGTRPRLQVANTSTGASVVPVQVRCTAYSDGGGKTTLTLENPLPDGWVAPTVGNSVYAGGPVVEQTCAALAAYVDSLGPARGTYAASSDPWESSCLINRLIQIVLDQVDGNGARYFANVQSSGATISYNGGAAAATDVAPTDSSTNGPELLWAQFAVVTA